MFITAQFTIARTWKQPRRPSGDKWIRKLWYIYTLEYYLAIKKNAFEPVLMKWMKLEPVIQSEVKSERKIPIQYAVAAAAMSLQSCPTLCNPIDGSPPGSSIHGIFQARVLEWGAIAFSTNTLY